MQRIFLIQENKTIDISKIVCKSNWSGNISEAARKLELTLVNPCYDYYFPKVAIKLGSRIVVVDEGIELFRGTVFYHEKTNQVGSIQITAYDDLIRLLKSTGTYNFQGKTAEQIVTMVGNNFGIPLGALEKTSIIQSFMIENESIYNIIMKAYSQAGSQNGKVYIPRMTGGKLNVIEIGKTVPVFKLSDATNITSSSYSETIEDMINRIKIYDESGKFLETVENRNWVNAYGILQGSYTREKDKQVKMVATNMLKGIAQSASVEAFGNKACIAGAGIMIEDSSTGLFGKFVIDSDTHTWENGKYTMQLALNFQNLLGKA